MPIAQHSVRHEFYETSLVEIPRHPFLSRGKRSALGVFLLSENHMKAMGDGCFQTLHYFCFSKTQKHKNKENQEGPNFSFPSFIFIFLFPPQIQNPNTAQVLVNDPKYILCMYGSI